MYSGLDIPVAHHGTGNFGYALYASTATSQLLASFLPQTLGETITVVNLGLISVGTTYLAFRQKKAEQDRQERVRDEQAERQIVSDRMIALHDKLDEANSATASSRMQAEKEREDLKQQILMLSESIKLKEAQMAEVLERVGKPENCPHSPEIKCIKIPGVAK
jgi:hypothetical protein